MIYDKKNAPQIYVLIESDWNLKMDIITEAAEALGINRIRLEFKGNHSCKMQA